MVRLIVPPTSEPITLDEAKTYLKIDVFDDDVLITSLITVARQMLENYLGISFLTQQWRYTIDNPKEYVYLPRPPIQSVQFVSVKGVTLTTTFEEDSGRVKFDPIPESATIDYTTGYTTLPEALKNAVLRLTAYLYENRTTTQIPDEVISAVESYKAVQL